MPDDPAVTQAKRLWKENQPREAMILLIRRVNELNQMVAVLQDYGARPDNHEENTGLIQWNKLGRAALGIILLIILLALCGLLR